MADREEHAWRKTVNLSISGDFQIQHNHIGAFLAEEFKARLPIPRDQHTAL
jgi:hypothetical protein